MTAEQFAKQDEWPKYPWLDNPAAFRFAEAYAAAQLAEKEREIERLNPHTVEDGFGSSWPPCEKHDCSMQVMRPGDARCPHCENEDYVDRLTTEIDRWKALYYEQEEILCSCNLPKDRPDLHYVCEWHEEHPKHAEAADHVIGLMQRAEAAEQRLQEAQALNVYFRNAVGECHLMISRNTPEYQVQQEWESTDLPPRLQKIMRALRQREAELEQRDPTGRTPKDYAIEFGEYLAKAAEQYLEQRNLYDAKESDSDALMDAWRALRSSIGEFRKRATRAAIPAPPKEGSDATAK